MITLSIFINMKYLIKKLLRKNLNELRTTEKPLFSGGSGHKIFTSNTDSNKLFKVGDEKKVLEWYELFKSFPNYFPRVFRHGKQKNNKYYVEVERLNTNRVIDEWNQLTDALDSMGIISKEINDNIDRIFKESLIDDELESYIIQSLSKYNKKANKLFFTWINFLHSVNKIVQPIKGSMLDIHMGNFGYDSKGKIKCLDI